MPKLHQLFLAAACAAGALLAIQPAPAGDRDSRIENNATMGEPPVFRDADGGAFRPRSLIVAGPGGALAARIPENPRQMQGENRVNLSGAPVVGSLFRPTLDVATARRGPLIGPVYRVGNALVVEAAETPPNLVGRPVALATNVPRSGAVSFQLGPLDWQPVPRPVMPRAEIGTAHIVDGELVLASRGGEPAWPSIGAFFRDLF